MTDDDSPVLIQRRLRNEIRRLREEANLTQKEVADDLDWSPSKIIRIESGATRIGISDLRILLMRYGVMDEERVAELVQMARASRQRTWRDKYRPHIEPQFFAFLGYEESATRIRQLQSMIIPGLLQTPEYVRSLSTAFLHDQERLDRGINIRSERQKILHEEPGRDVVFLLEEATLRRRIGSWEVMQGQLERIIDLAQRPNITIRVIPFDSDTYRGVGGSFAIFDLPPDSGDHIVFVQEFLRDIMVHDSVGEIQNYLDIFSEAERQAWSASESLKFLNGLLDEAATRS